MACFQVDVVSALASVCSFLMPKVTILKRHRKTKEALDEHMIHLRDVKLDVERRLQREVFNPQMEPTAEVCRWMKDVDTLDEGVSEFLKSFDDKTTKGCFRGWCLCWSKYKAGKMAMDMVEQVRRMTERREKIGDNLTQSRPKPTVEEIQNTTSSIVGSEGTLSQVRNLLKDNNVGIIGMYGLGGVGKTTLLRSLNNEMLKTGSKEFDVVIWITVSRDMSIPKIQKDIGDRLNLSLSDEDIEISRAKTVIFSALSKKRFLILLDDVWARLDLHVVGIPFPDGGNNGRKIVLTTRSTEVCIDMGARMVKVAVLDEAASWDLFRQKVGEEVDITSPRIRPHAEEVVSRCGGLPLMLITVGRAMANKKDPREWAYAVRLLRNSPGEVRGMVPDVFVPLKFSFDNLESEALKSCLLYCALFPEDYEIDVGRLVDYWIAQGFVQGDDDDQDGGGSDGGELSDLRNKARDMITRLQAACLVEYLSSDSFRGDWLRMHDSIRDMALWLTRRSVVKEDEDVGGGERMKEVFVVHTTAAEGEVLLPVAKWKEATRVSVLAYDHRRVILFPKDLPQCSSMSTLLFPSKDYVSRLTLQVPNALFQSVPNLRVLELSRTGIEELPASIGLLANLRYLGLTATRIRSLPKEVGDLVNLRQLELERTFSLRDIPREAITRLQNLQVLNMFGCHHHWLPSSTPSYEEAAGSSTTWTDEDDQGRLQGGDGGGVVMQQQILQLGDLEGLTQLRELGITVTSLSSLQQLASSSSKTTLSQYSVVFLSFNCGVDDGVADAGEVSAALENLIGRRLLRRLQVLLLYNPYPNSERPTIWKGELRLHGDQFPDLEALRLEGSGSNIQLVVDARGGQLSDLFQSLSTLILRGIDGICDLNWVGKLPSLKTLHIWSCNQLVELIQAAELIDGKEEDHDELKISYFRKLEYLFLWDLPVLESISRRRPLLLPSLKEMHVRLCPRLKELPFDTHSAKNLTSIHGDREWWDGLKWDNDSVKAAFTPYFNQW